MCFVLSLSHECRLLVVRTKRSSPLLGAVGDFVLSFSAYNLAWLHAQGWGGPAVSAQKRERHQAESGLRGDNRHPYFFFFLLISALWQGVKSCRCFCSLEGQSVNISRSERHRAAGTPILPKVQGCRDTEPPPARQNEPGALQPPQLHCKATSKLVH